MKTHTPGPWKWSKDEYNCCWQLIGADGTMVADDGSAGDEYDRTIDSEGDEVNRANACLIAAAAELGEILLSAYLHVSHGGPTRGRVKTVLKKAGLL